MRKTTILWLILFSIGTSHAQIKVSGIVSDLNTGRPLAYAHVYQYSNNSVGTITNNEGFFSLFLPSIKDSLSVSFVGYRTKLIRLDEIEFFDDLSIRLEESPNELKEILVYAKDTLNEFLKKVYSKIPDNYPKENFLIKGYYRETNLLQPTNQFVYFSEAKIEFFSPSYTNIVSKYGPVRIIEGGKVEVENRYSYSNIHFFAGLYSPQRFDFVREEFEFIKPAFLDKYEYEVDKFFDFEGRPTIAIAFKPKTDGLYQGKLFIDQTTLAYVKCDFELSLVGLKKENALRISSFSYQSRNYITQYKLGKDSRWHVWFAIQDGKGTNSKYKADLRYTNEFISTEEVQVDNNPIPDSEAVPYYSFYTSQENKFNNDYWKKPETFARVSKSDSAIRFLFKDLSKKQLVNEDSINQKNKQNTNFKKRFLKVSSKLSSAISFTFVPMYQKTGIYSLSSANFLSVSKEIGDIGKTALGIDIKYYLNNNYCFILQSYGNITSSSSMSMASLGLQVSKRLLGWKRPLYLEPGLHVYYSTSEVKLGSTFATNTLSSSGVTFKTNEKIFLGTGQENWGLSVSGELIYKFHSRFSIFAKIASSFYVDKTDRIVLRKNEQSFFGSNKALMLNLKSNDALLLIDNNALVKSPTGYNEIQFIINSGLRFGLFR